MKKLILLTWNSGEDEGKPFGIFTDQQAANNAIEMIAKTIQVLPESLKADLYIYELPVDQFYNPAN